MRKIDIWTVMLAVLTGPLLVSCGNESNDVDVRYIRHQPYRYDVDEEILPYYESFQNLYGVDISHIPANFVKTPSELAGQCFKYADGHREIVLNLRYWDVAADYARESLVFHELGHCALNLKHNENLMDTVEYGKVPESIMWPTNIGGSNYYKDYRGHYINQLIEGI